MSFGRAQAFNFRPTPPLKGSFPLDHEGECQLLMKEYLACLKENKAKSLPCRSFSKNYLKCRMERDLMAPEDFEKLGFKVEPKPPETLDKV